MPANRKRTPLRCGSNEPGGRSRLRAGRSASVTRFTRGHHSRNGKNRAYHGRGALSGETCCQRICLEGTARDMRAVSHRARIAAPAPTRFCLTPRRPLTNRMKAAGKLYCAKPIQGKRARRATVSAP
jgi:hypothetical protein